MVAHSDGSLSIWSIRKTTEPMQRWTPHDNKKNPANSGGIVAGDETKKLSIEKCRPIVQVEWRHGRDDDELVIFSGGMPLDDAALPAITVLRGSKSATVLEMEHPIISFCTLCQSPYAGSIQQPYAVAVLLKNDLLIVDLTSPGFVCM